ncbi:MAG TPA: ABC transporter ATP-binding protein [Candidatus Cloacimonadota bacterium]|nr:ABC transporter ATP-binding protein [Candidatus Cloacimonadota bacterium]HOQ80540.1 ABC transporter ATP-binding protein [Candidatus Cloacimonadota bacterium]
MIEINNLNVILDNNEILKDISLQIRENEIISILGPNGAGKSTLLKAILNIVNYQKGSISYLKDNEKIDLHSLTRKNFAQLLAYIPQENNMQFDYSVKEIILMGRFPWIDYWGSYTSKDVRIVEEISKTFNVYNLLNRNYNNLSGGEKQRVLLARALAQESSFIFLDETLSFLDINHQIEIMQILRDLQHKYRKTIVIVSHNINLSIEYSDRIIILKSGNVLADGQAAEIITPSIIKQAFNIDICINQNPYSQKPNLLYCNRENL